MALPLEKSAEVHSSNDGFGAELHSVKAALDQLSEAVTVFNGAKEVVYINRAARTMFSTLESQIRTEVPDFDAERLEGSRSLSGPISRIGFNPDHGVWVRLGDASLRAYANLVTDETGDVTGLVVEWEDVSEEYEADLAIARLLESTRSASPC